MDKKVLISRSRNRINLLTHLLSLVINLANLWLNLAQVFNKSFLLNKYTTQIMIVRARRREAVVQSSSKTELKLS